VTAVGRKVRPDEPGRGERVAVDEDDNLAARTGEGGIPGRAPAAPLAKADQRDGTIPLHRLEPPEGVVGRRVVGDKHLVAGRLEVLGQQARDALHRGRSAVARRNDDTGVGDGGPVLAVEPRFRALKAEDRYFCFRSADDERVVDFADLILGSRAGRPKADLRSLSAVDAYVRDRIHMGAGLIEELGYTDHVRRIAAGYGDEALVIVNLPSPVCEIFDPLTGYLGFEAGLLAIHDHPEGLLRLLERCYESHLEWARAYARAGAHAFVVSETFFSPDLVGPEVYCRFLKGLHRDYFREIESCGLIPICYFLGDVNPLLDDLTEIGIRGLLVEEGKKTFRLEVGEIWRRLEGRLALFGNLDSIAVLQDGTPEQVRAEVRRQQSQAPSGFVVANGSPITPGTPPENLQAMVQACRELH
jgi:hypothetical protein